MSKDHISQDFLDYDAMFSTEYDEWDVLIYEDGNIKRYKDSNQYRLDYNIETMEEQIERLNKENWILQKDKNRILTKFEELDIQRKILSTK